MLPPPQIRWIEHSPTRRETASCACTAAPSQKHRTSRRTSQPTSSATPGSATPGTDSSLPSMTTGWSASPASFPCFLIQTPPSPPSSPPSPTLPVTSNAPSTWPELAVAPGARGLGLGARLVDARLQWARERQLDWFVMRTDPGSRTPPASTSAGVDGPSTPSRTWEPARGPTVATVGSGGDPRAPRQAEAVYTRTAAPTRTSSAATSRSASGGAPIASASARA